MNKKIIQIIIALILFVVSIAISFSNHLIANILFFISYIIVGLEVIWEAIENLFKGKFLDENFLMSIATLGAFAIGEFPEAVAVMLFYQIGEFFQDYAVDKSKKSIASLMEIRPDFANVKRGNEVLKVNPEDVKIGELILVKPGEKLPLDGTVVEGVSMLDTSAITGESVPREVHVGDDVISGCLNQKGVLTIKVTKEFANSTVSKILDLVENASNKKSKSENFISKFARYYTPIVVFLAVALAIFPPLFFKNTTSVDWLYRALTFLVVSCPCALVISIPLGFFGGIGGASKLGILIKGSNYLEALSSIEIIAFDKTGTLTEGIFEVQKIEAFGISKEDLLKYATLAESYSNHPISLSLQKAYGTKIEQNLVTNVEELPGLGVSARVLDANVLIGNEKLMKNKQIAFSKCDELGTILYVAINNAYSGYIVIADKIKADSKQTIEYLKNKFVKKTVMLTGDKKAVGESVANLLGIDIVYSELLPDEKAEKLDELMNNKSSNGKLAFVGDGVNDAPVLALADIGVAMGALGSDSAIEAADIVIMTDEPSKIISAIKISRKTMHIVKENIVFAILVKFVVLILSAFGISSMWAAVFADVGVSIISVINSLRVLNVKELGF